MLAGCGRANAGAMSRKNEPPPEPRLLLTVPAAAAALSLSRRTVERLMTTGHLPSRRIGRRRLIPAEAVRRLAARDLPTIAPAAAPPGAQS